MSKTKRFKMAREEMLSSDYSGNARVGCVVFYKGSLLAKGHNSNKTSPIQDHYNKYRYRNPKCPAKNHAEITALKKIKYLDIDFSLVEVYNYRELKNGQIAMSRPCESCMAFIKSLGIKKINYSTPDGFASEKIAVAITPAGK